MRITLVWPIGQHDPGDVIDAVPQVARVLLREGLAYPAEGPAVVPEPEPPTVAELRAYAAEHGITTTEARRRVAADLAARRQGAATC